MPVRIPKDDELPTYQEDPEPRPRPYRWPVIQPPTNPDPGPKPIVWPTPEEIA